MSHHISQIRHHEVQKPLLRRLLGAIWPPSFFHVRRAQPDFVKRPQQISHTVNNEETSVAFGRILSIMLTTKQRQRLAQDSFSLGHSRVLNTFLV